MAALTGALMEVDLVIIATNTDGIYTKESIDEKVKSTIRTVTDLKALEKEVTDGKSSQGTGGMQSKIEAAEILKKEQIETWIVNGIGDNFILNAMNEQIAFTKILNS